jgi:hypothetical protein
VVLTLQVVLYWWPTLHFKNRLVSLAYLAVSAMDHKSSHWRLSLRVCSVNDSDQDFTDPVAKRH